ncbi:hypothetical protein SVIOM74S_04202 [Streptomyces violarus]
MRTRMDRYEEFLSEHYRKGFTKSDEYSLDELTDSLRARIAAGHFKRVVFTGMGCSAIVSDVVRAFFISTGTEVEFHVFNDYDHAYLLPSSVIDDDRTLIILSSYSGHSLEPARAFHTLAHAHDRMILLTSGGRLAELGREAGVSILRWELSEPDREYPLFHVGQYFAILLEVFFRLGLVPQDFGDEVRALPDHLAHDFTHDHRELAGGAALRSRDANIIMIASPMWHESLLKLAKMHLNEALAGRCRRPRSPSGPAPARSPSSSPRTSRTRRAWRTGGPPPSPPSQGTTRPPSPRAPTDSASGGGRSPCSTRSASSGSTGASPPSRCTATGSRPGPPPA